MIKDIIETLNGSLTTAHTFVVVNEEFEANQLFDDLTFPATVLFLQQNYSSNVTQSGLNQVSYSNLQIAFLNEVIIDATGEQTDIVLEAERNAATQMINLMKTRSEWLNVSTNTNQPATINNLVEGYDDNVAGVVLNFTNLVLQYSNVCA